MMDSGTFYLWQGSGEWLSSGHTIRPSSTPCSPTRDWKQPARAPSHSRIRVAWRGMTWYNLCTNSACWLWKEMEGILWINFQDTWIILCKRLKKKKQWRQDNTKLWQGNRKHWQLELEFKYPLSRAKLQYLKAKVVCAIWPSNFTPRCILLTPGLLIVFVLIVPKNPKGILKNQVVLCTARHI